VDAQATDARTADGPVMTEENGRENQSISKTSSSPQQPLPFYLDRPEVDH